MDWIKVKDKLPENGILVETKVDDRDDLRNVLNLMRLNHLWFIPDGSVFVYYVPTHWRYA